MNILRILWVAITQVWGSILHSERGGTGLQKDQTALYLLDMYEAEREGEKLEDPKFQEIFSVVPNAKGAGDKSTQLLGTGRLDRHITENQDISFRAPVEGWAFYVRFWRYSDGLVLSKEAVEDVNPDKVRNILKDIAGTWGESLIFEKETFASTIFNSGGLTAGTFHFDGSHTGNTDPSGNLLYDNFPLFNLTGNARATKGEGTYFNAVAGLSLSPTNFETLYNRMTVSIAFNEQDRAVTNRADTLLVQSGADKFLAWRITKSELLPGTQMNDKNPFLGLVDHMDWRYLTESFYVGKKKHPKFQWHERQQPEIRFFRDETNKSYKASFDVRFGVMIKTFRAWVKGGGTFT